MFKGNNVLKLNEATVITALEEYLNARIVTGADEVRISSIVLDASMGTGRWFSVAVTSDKEKAAK
jgi:hypothetical protein